MQYHCMLCPMCNKGGCLHFLFTCGWCICMTVHKHEVRTAQWSMVRNGQRACVMREGVATTHDGIVQGHNVIATRRLLSPQRRHPFVLRCENPRGMAQHCAAVFSQSGWLAAFRLIPQRERARTFALVGACGGIRWPRHDRDLGAVVLSVVAADPGCGVCLCTRTVRLGNTISLATRDINHARASKSN
jgi:hypothetical protein